MLQRIGRYQITGELGRGAMGVVYRALDPAIGRTVAIKTIRLTQFDDASEREAMRDRLFREAQSAGILSHPNLVTIYDVAEEGGNAYIFMEFVDGPTLDQRLSSQPPLSPPLLLDLFRQCASGLDYAHRKGIVHRDIKPANIMIAEGGIVKITDFGIARMESRQMTQAGVVLGTPNYMSPEQFSGAQLSGRSDQFSLAVIAYEVLTGEKPFVAESLSTLMYRIVSEAPTPPHRINPSLGPAIATVMSRAMAKEAADRYPTCSEFIAALTDACGSTPGWQPMSAGMSGSLPTMSGPKAPSKALVESSELPTLPGLNVPKPAPPVPASPPNPPPSLVSTAPAPANATEARRRAAEAETKDPETAGGAAPIALPPPTRSSRDYQEESGEEKPKRDRSGLILLLVGLLVIVGVGLGAAWFLKQRGADAQQQAQNTPPQTSPGNEPDNRPSPERRAAPPPVSGGSTPESTQPATEPGSGAIREVPATPEPPSQPRTPPSKPNSPEANPQRNPPPQVKPGPGDLLTTVTTNPPGAAVTFDNNDTLQCKTPCNFTLGGGRHTLSAKLEGYRPALRIFELPRDANVFVNLEKAQGMLRVTTDPAGATITVNGQKQGQATPATLTLAPGQYKIELAREGYRTFSDEVTVRDQTIGHLDIALGKN